MTTCLEGCEVGVPKNHRRQPARRPSEHGRSPRRQLPTCGRDRARYASSTDQGWPASRRGNPIASRYKYPVSVALTRVEFWVGSSFRRFDSACGRAFTGWCCHPATQECRTPCEVPAASLSFYLPSVQELSVLLDPVRQIPRSCADTASVAAGCAAWPGSISTTPARLHRNRAPEPPPGAGGK
jgi:hypothetical protein